MNVAENADKPVVLMKAFNNACEALNFSDNDKSKLLEVNKSILARNINKGFPHESKAGELQLQFIMLYRSIFAISGGDSEFMLHWFNTDNHALNDVPASLCLSSEGLLRTNEYLDTIRS